MVTRETATPASVSGAGAAKMIDRLDPLTGTIASTVLAATIAGANHVVDSIVQFASEVPLRAVASCPELFGRSRGTTTCVTTVFFTVFSVQILG
jgi:hypothetical protein